MKPIRLFSAVLGLAGLTGLGVQAGEEGGWSQFRGPNGSGVAANAVPPVKIDSEKPAWRTPVPPGKSSPILQGGKLFVTGVEEQRLVTLALNSETGKLLWRQLAPEVPFEPVHPAGSPATATPCADADRLYVYFGSYGLLCYDHAGQLRWQKAIPTPKSMYGVATSPILCEGRLILLVDDDADLPGSKLSRSRIMAFDRATGAVVWETARPYNRGAWSTPVCWKHDQGADLVALGDGRATGYDPATGAERWYVTGFAREPISMPVAGDGLLYASAAMQGGRGDAKLDPEPFWQAMLHFDRDGDGRVGRDEITEYFTWPIRPELPPEHPGFGIPLPNEPTKRREAQLRMFDSRDKNHDGFLTKEEFIAGMSSGRAGPVLAAIRPGGTGDVTETHVKWHLRSGIPEIPSPIFHAGRLYLVRDGGVLTCVRTDSGETVYRERLGAGGQYATSPVIANERLYLVSGSGVLTVVKCGDQFAIEHRTDLKAPTAATPAVEDKSVYIRAGNELLAFR